MNPAIIAAIIGYAVKYGPTAAAALSRVFQKKEVTPAELAAAFELADLSYDDIVHPGKTLPS